jgi:uncharacterized protein YidB (DUF937 family)
VGVIPRSYAFAGLAGQEITMGLLDILNGMANGPRGPSDPNDKSGGMSPMTMAILALLAYKGYKHIAGSQTAPQGTPQRIPPNTTQASVPDSGGGLGGLLGGLLGGNSASAAGGGGLGDLLKGPLGGMLAGGAAGSVLSGGLGDLLKQFQQNGHGEAADSWVGSGPNKQISPNDLGAALGADQIAQLTSQTGMSREQLLSELSNELPDAVNDFTPHGRLPTEDEATSRWV